MTKRKSLKKCNWCEEMKADVIDGCCPECGERNPWCTICNERQDEDHPCRHLYQDDDSLVFVGSGSDEWDPKTDFGLKPSFFALLCRLGCASTIRRTIAAGQWSMYSISNMLGPEDWCIDIPGPRPGVLGPSIGRRVTHNRDGSIISDAIVDKTKLGVCWLASLDHDRTPDANKFTLYLIDEFLAGRKAARHQSDPSDPSSRKESQ